MAYSFPPSFSKPPLQCWSEKTLQISSKGFLDNIERGEGVEQVSVSSYMSRIVFGRNAKSVTLILNELEQWKYIFVIVNVNKFWLKYLNRYYYQILEYQ